MDTRGPVGRRTRQTLDVATAQAGELADLALQAYIWGYPAVQMDRTRKLLTGDHAFGAPVNSFFHASRLLTADDRAVVKPNNDTLYSSAWLDLSREPLILSVPDTGGRYYSLFLMDAYTNGWGYVGRRTTGTRSARFVIAGPRWTGPPPGDPVLVSPTDTVWLLGRTLVDGPEDLFAARASMRQYTLEALSGGAAELERHRGPAPSTESLGAFGISFFDEMCAVWAKNPPPAAERPFLDAWGRLGLAAGRVPSEEVRDPLARTVLERIGLVGDPLLALSTPSSGDGPPAVPRRNGWDYQLATGSYGQNFLLRARVAYQGIGAVHPREALYVTCRADAAGRPLRGDRRYVLRFPPGRLPPVDAFWSITAYGADQYLIPNSVGRHSIGDRTRGLISGADGSLDILIQTSEPAQGTANWLPVGEGPFELVLRCYQPKAELLDGRYAVPPLEAAEVEPAG
ncbi:DUF1254 domain-containing protein [Streptomyces sp. NPDC006284]|uniref:DUF1254 domain-containing protein n=1 Tax=Streptomyces sp. NPDC006284 TaxID=3156742 RepID=UPI0033B9A872